MALIGIVLLMVIWLFCLTCVMDSKISKIAADIDEIKNTFTNNEMFPPVVSCCGEPSVIMLVNDKWFYWCNKCGSTYPVA